MTDSLLPVVRHLKVDSPRRVVGIDHLSLELDSFGNSGAYVIRDHFTKLVGIYPSKSHDAQSAATAIFQYCVTYAAFDLLISDPASEFTSTMLATLNSWFGVHHRFSLVDRHESNGVEGANKQILKHLKTLLCDERIKQRWSSPSVIGWTVFIMNTFDDSESGGSPYSLTFGSESIRNLRFPVAPLNSNAPDFLKQLDEGLKTIRAIALDFQKALINKRVNPIFSQNLFQPGDLVLHQHPLDKPLPSKLLPRYAGPFEVLMQRKNDVECRHLVQGGIKTFFVGTLKPFFGSRDDAFKLAMVDADQHVIDKILAYRGDPLKRLSTSFLVRFMDGDEIWLPWSDDLFSTIQYEEYCRKIPALFPLIHRLKESKRELSNLNNTPISRVKPGDEVFVDLRSFGYSWYEELCLPNADIKTYVLIFRYLNWTSKPLKIKVRCDIFRETFEVDHTFVHCYGSVTTFNPEFMVLIDDSFVKLYPQVLPKNPIKQK
jgi:hypothetical protein